MLLALRVVPKGDWDPLFLEWDLKNNLDQKN